MMTSHLPPSNSLEASIFRVLNSLAISIETVEGRSPFRILRFLETKYSISLPGVAELESLGEKRDCCGKLLNSDVLMSETVEHRPNTSSLQRLVAKLKVKTDPIYVVLLALVALLYSVAEFGTGGEFFKFLHIFKVIVERDKLVGAQIISLFLSPAPNSELKARTDRLFLMLKIPRSQHVSLGDYLGQVASSGPIEMSGFGPTPLYFGRNGNGIFVSNPTSFGDFASRTVFQPHGTRIHNISTDATWVDLLKSGVIRPVVYEEFDCRPYFESTVLLAEAGKTQADLRRMSKDFAEKGQYELALSCRVAADIMICCENNTSIVDTGLLLKINPAGKVWNHEGAVLTLLSQCS